MLITRARNKNRANDGILLILRVMNDGIVSFELTTTGDLKYQLNLDTRNALVDDVTQSFILKSAEKLIIKHAICTKIA